MFRLPLMLCTLVLPTSLAPIPATNPAPKNGEELVAMMRARYAGKWYKTLTFVQKTTFPDGRIETWYEALELPGKLRIDVLGFDVYEAPAKETIRKLQNLKFDLSKLH